MNQKNSNKYLFNQEVSCTKCKHLVIEQGYLLCRLNPSTYVDGFQYRVVELVRSEYFCHTITKGCGPIGKYYESI